MGVKATFVNLIVIIVLFSILSSAVISDSSNSAYDDSDLIITNDNVITNDNNNENNNNNNNQINENNIITDNNITSNNISDNNVITNPQNANNVELQPTTNETNNNSNKDLIKEQQIIAHFFYGEGCPHCAKLEPVLAEFENKYPEFKVVPHETWHNTQNSLLFVNLSEACGAKVSGVPTLFIGDEIIVGFNEKSTPDKIEKIIQDCVANGCEDPMNKISCKDPSIAAISNNRNNNTIVDLPLFGQVDTSKISLPIFTIILGFLDGFNPCAMWVLTFLLTLLIYAKSRKKIIIIGSIFVIASGFIYFLFMAAWLNFFLFIGYVQIMRILIAVVAIIAGLINIKDFFWYKKGVSLTISEKYKPKLYSKMRNLVKEEAFFGMIVGTIVLAVFSNMIELLCTAGFPAIFTKILTLQNMNSFTYYSYLALYNLIYVIPLVTIVTVFAITMGGRKFTEKHGKILKIIGGLLMLILGLILLIKPELLSF